MPVKKKVLYYRVKKMNATRLDRYRRKNRLAVVGNNSVNVLNGEIPEYELAKHIKNDYPSFKYVM